MSRPGGNITPNQHRRPSAGAAIRKKKTKQAYPICANLDQTQGSEEVRSKKLSPARLAYK